MAALLRDELGVETEIAPGARKEFSVFVDGRRAARRLPLFGLPSDAKILRAVKRALR